MGQRRLPDPPERITGKKETVTRAALRLMGARIVMAEVEAC
jgi:hypothetical protein